MLCKSLLSLILLVDVVNCQPYVSFATDMEVQYQQENLPFTCSPTSTVLFGTITDITLWKNSTSGWKQIVKIWLKIENGQVVNEITWTNTEVRNRATVVNKKVHPSSQAGFQIEISPINVKCSDSGEYKCSITGNTGSIKIDSESAPKTVGIRAEPALINPIQVQPPQPDDTYSPYTSVRLTCNGDVGNPASNLRWCIRTMGSNMMGDFTVYGNTNDITHGTPTLSGCQYHQQSILTYNVSETIAQADFRCETGGTSTTCGHSSAIAANYTIYRCDVNCQTYVSFATDMDVLYQQEKLPFTCSPMSTALSGTITDITLWKNSTSGWKQIVKIWLKIENGQVVNEITWTNTDVRNRATIVNKKVHPTSQAGLQIEISPISVKCSDGGEYKCSISGNTGSINILDSESAPKTVGMRGDVVNCQTYVTIATDNEVMYQQEKLPFTCSPTGAALSGMINDITLWKNSTSGWKEIVKIWLKIENGQVVNEITWTNTDVRNRATIINQKVHTSSQAGLQIEISPISVKCSDSGEYKCSISGNIGSINIDSESALKTVGIRAEPASINPIEVQPQQSDNTYNPYKSVRLTCNGDVGNSTSNLRWCIRTTGSTMMGDFTVYDNTNDIAHGKPTLSGCQYRQQSVLTYNVSETIAQADFRCETGGTSTTCGHSSAIAAIYTIYMYRCDVVNCQTYVSFATDIDVLYQQEKLPFTCSPTSRVLSGTITDITLWKNSTSGWEEVVKIWLKIENGQVVNEITWTNTDVRNRATIVNKKVHPAIQAGLQIEMSAINVKCSDRGEYKCSITGNTGSINIDSESAHKTVRMRGDIVNCHTYVTIATDNEVMYQEEKILFTCSPTGAALSGTITDITLWKNSTSGWKEIVKIWLKIENVQVVNEITWTNTDVRNRVTILNKKVHPSIQAGLEIEISPISVKCSDSGEYKCSISGNTGSINIDSESAPKTVGIRAEPASINPIEVQPQQPDNTYSPYTSVRLTCNGDVGDPTSNLRWCIRTTGSNMMGDFTVYGNTNDITHGTPTLSGCQYRQQSVLTYNVSETIAQADFRCETGGTSTTCGHSSAIAAIYTIYMYRCDVVNCQTYVSFATDMGVLYQQEKLPFTCIPTSRVLSGTITDITLWKNSTSGWKEIVKIWLKIENGQVVNEITWTNIDVRNRATIVNKKVHPSSQAGLQIEISPISVKCSDSGEYKCSISGNTGSINIDSESAPKTVGIRGDVVNCQTYVTIATDNEVMYQEEKLPFTCSPTGAALSGTITDITLWKNSTSGWKEIVKIWLKIENNQVVNEITWKNTDVRNRATIINQKVHPSIQAGLQIEISPISVKCSDSGEYKCSISGNTGSININSESAPKTVGMRGDVVNCQTYVTIATDNEVMYQQEKLPFTCSPTGAALSGTITDITLWKYSASGWKEIVKIWLKIENDQVVNEITWKNTDVRNRVTIINQKVNPSSEAGLQIEISPINVKYSDKGVYKCSISGNSGLVSIGSESEPKTVAVATTGAINKSSGNLFPNPIIYFVLCIMYSSIL